MDSDGAVIAVATKCDLLSGEQLAKKNAEFRRVAAAEFIPTSAKTGLGLEQLKDLIGKEIGELTRGSGESAMQIAVTQRHRRALDEATVNILQAKETVGLEKEEVAAMFLRAAYEALGPIETENVDEAILGEIFSHFCIGK